MPDALGHEIIDALLAVDGYEVFVSGKNVCYVATENPAFEKFMREVVRLTVKNVNSLHELPEQSMKISAYREDIIDGEKCVICKIVDAIKSSASTSKV